MLKDLVLKHFWSASSGAILGRRFLWGGVVVSLTYLLTFGVSWLKLLPPEKKRTAPLEVSLPAPVVPAAPSPPKTLRPLEKVLRLKAGGTLLSLMREGGIARDESQALVNLIKPHMRLRDLKVGQVFKFFYQPSADGAPEKLIRVIIHKSAHEELLVQRRSDGTFFVKLIKHVMERFPVVVAGSIKSCFYDDALKGGLPPAILKQVVQLLGYKFDLQRDFHPNDRFRVLFENVVNKVTGKAVDQGTCLFVEVTIRGVSSRIYCFKRSLHHGVDFFDEKGRGVKSHFLRTPLDGARLTSRFGYRTHPILGYTRLHRGIDFGAARGTPVMAAADGVVAKAFYNGSYGNYVMIRHAGAYATAYAHLSRYAQKIRSGARVKQGQIIGYVGATGRVTGPHLHFELIKNGRPINPRSVRMLPNVKLSGKEFQQFKLHMEEIDALYARSVSS